MTEPAASASFHLASLPNTHTDVDWIADTGATSHMSPCYAVYLGPTGYLP
jgi:hypothetical protein